MLAEYSKNTLDEVEEIGSKIPEDKKVRVYYAKGENGLTTNSKGSIHAELIDLVEGLNIVEARSEGHGVTEMNFEQLLDLNPEKIITNIGSKERLLSDDNWSTIKAVEDKEIYEIPELPFNWFDNPPSVARILGVKWAGKVIYPEYFKYDIEKETKDFFEKFYNLKLTDEELREILGVMEDK